MKVIKGFIINLQFFTALPIHMEIPMDREHLRNAAGTFPVLGLLLGGFYAVLLYALVEWTPLSPLAVAFFLWLAMIAATGGLHLDGWMDASDAFFSYRDHERRLEIMSDSRTGAFGVLSVIVLLSARFLFIYEVVLMLNPVAYILVIWIPFLRRCVMGATLFTIRAAKQSGLAVLFREAGGVRSLWLYPVYFAVLAAICFMAEPASLWPVLILAGAAAWSYVFIRRGAVAWFGGITGDVLGASVEGTEVVLWMTLWLLHYSAML